MHQAGLFVEESALPSGLVYQPAFLSEAEEGAALEGIAGLELQQAK